MADRSASVQKTIDEFLSDGSMPNLLQPDSVGIVDPLSAQSLMADVQRLVDMGWKRNGSAAARRAAAWFRAEFEASGLQTTVEEWPFNLYYPQEWAVQLTHSPAADAPVGPTSAASLPIWYSAAGQLEAELIHIDARAGVPDLAAVQLAGKVVLVDVEYIGNFVSTDGSSTADTGLYAAVVAAGAVGYIRKAGAPGNDPTLMHFAQNFPTHRQDARMGAVPAFTVGRSDFAGLAQAALAGGARVSLRLGLTDVPKGGWRTVEGGSLGPGTHELRAVVEDVVGVLPGLTEEVIVVGAHYDTTFDGAVDNATGDAVLLGLLRHYAALPVTERPKTMVFLASGAHDTGDFDLYHFVEQHADGLLARATAFNWLDHLAAQEDTGTPDLHVQRGLIAATNHQLRDLIACSMAPAGIPTEPAMPPMSTISHLPTTLPSYNVTLAPPSYHSVQDTIDGVPADGLARMAAAQRHLLDALHHTDGAALRAANGVAATAGTAPADLLRAAR